MSNLVKRSGGKYYLKPDTEISQEQYDAINDATQQSVSGSNSEADILRLHQEQDPASPFYKGSESIEPGVSSTAAGEAEPTLSYYEPTGDNLDKVADEVPEPQGTSVITTEQATIPPVIEPTSKEEVTEKDLAADLKSTEDIKEDQLKQSPATPDKIASAKEAEQLKSPKK